METLKHFQSSTISPLLKQLRVRKGVQTETLAADATLSAQSANFLNLDPGGASRSVTLPAVAASEGLFFFIFNAGSSPEVLTVQTAAPATVAVVDAGEACLVGCDGAAWFKLLLSSTELSSLLTDMISEKTSGAGVTFGSKLILGISGGGVGSVVEIHGSATEGWQRVVYEATVSPAAVETAVVTVPAGSVIDGVWANAEAALTGGGTTVTWSLGITGDVDKYGTATSDGYTTQADSLAKNKKWSYVAQSALLGAAGAGIGLFSTSAIGVKLIGAATGGAAAGDTALTVGSVKVRVEYRTALSLDDAA